MHKNLWRPGLRPGPNWGAYSTPPGPIAGGEGREEAVAQCFGLRASAFRASYRSRNVDFIPTPLLSATYHAHSTTFATIFLQS